jgi:transcription elongation factor/antiterminator RfaH
VVERPLAAFNWYVLRAHHWQESRAESNLNNGGLETFLPWVRTTSRRRHRDREPLFPQYLFARFDAEKSFHDVIFTRGVQSIVRIGGDLATVADGVIEFFRSRVDDAGLIPLGRKLEPGARVRIHSGPFAELAGVVERNLPGSQRVLVLLQSVGPAVRVEVPADHVALQNAGFVSY